MSYSLSLLDKSLIPEGADAAQTFQHTIALARRAERLGYRRYWLAEHHGNRTYAGSAPEVLASHLLAKTSRIRIGTGGVMLQHYSPFKVAETFKVLASLAPGRVDLGIGKAPGGLPLTSKALQSLHDPVKAKALDFEARLRELDAFLHDGVPADHALAGAVATPFPPVAPQRVLLGGSPESALLALFAFAAETHDEAAERVGALRSFRVTLPTGQSVNLPSLEAAAEFARQAGASDYRTEERRPHVIAGTGDEVRDALEALSARHGIEEFVIDIPVADFGARATAVELLAQAREPALA